MVVTFCARGVRGWRSFTAIQNRNLVSKGLSRQLRMSSNQNPEKYDHLQVEKKWQTYWDENKIFVAKRRVGHPKKYVLDMFPYPSGSGLHVGHPEGYTATDIMARYWRMLDFDVLHPMGWDSFGLPAEQHAINTGTHPAITTYENIATFKRQLKSLGFSYDWTRELATTDDGYVRWTQWIFLKLFNAGLAAQSEVSVNWCPALGTVLSNEEIIDGLSERGNHPVVRQPLRQWILKITDYADKLEEGLDKLQWPEGTLAAQKQWIGRSVGASIVFDIEGNDEKIEVFTTRPDTIMGVTYVVLAPEHPYVSKLTTAENKDKVQKYVKDIVGKSDMERTSTGVERGKTGVPLGAYAIHPISKEKMPIWAADYVLAGYGTGAVMAVPAHDERDLAFAEKFSLGIKSVVKPVGGVVEGAPLLFTDTGITCNSDEFNNLSTEECKSAVIKRLISLNAGGEKVTYKLRDWVFSRQRYWGEPIPIFFPVEMLTEDGSGSPIEGAPHRILHDQPIPVPDSELPLKLPDMDNFQPGDDPRGCLARAVDWRFFQKDGKWFARETNTMPQWAGSCWYYLRFTDTKNTEQLFGEEGKSWLPVDLYVGGQEHAVLHLLYARFWHKVLYDLGILEHSEPFTKLVHQGMILGMDGEKMSKSRGNVINPDDVVNEHGADALRLYEMFMGPLEAVKPWQTNQLSGVVRFRDRVFSLVNGKLTKNPPEGQLLKDMHKTIKKVTKDIDKLAFNTAISNMMIFTNTLNALDTVPKECVENLILLLAPIAPHIAEESWEVLGHKKCISLSKWPVYDESLCIDTTAVVAIQVNGKVRGTMEIDKLLSQDDAMVLAQEIEGVTKWTSGMQIKKIIYVPGKILNIVIGAKIEV
eukprot:CAMPEP_0119045114 /NCGR_PEP_ID=MMETSP1177-20130426/37135_1 /TAXON_ID=2985 /ORGANISM="Ochromonas sp, Strain CCMP1899" /LENGTH=867 /DNA_ID=CAMNT_0007016313 /DNA_START=17 /DNA_END=2620 /DNA_ORIENTATION=+